MSYRNRVVDHEASDEREFIRGETRQEFRWSAESLGDFRYGGYELICRLLNAIERRPSDRVNLKEINRETYLRTSHRLV